jgi:hypothetical protein
MAINAPKYQSSAVDIASAALGIGNAFRSDREYMNKKLEAGIKGAGEALGGAIGSYQRGKLVYKGDEYLEGLKARKAEIEARLQEIDREIAEANREQTPQELGPSLSEVGAQGMEGYEPGMNYEASMESKFMYPDFEKQQNAFNKYRYKSTGASGLI